MTSTLLTKKPLFHKTKKKKRVAIRKSQDDDDDHDDDDDGENGDENGDNSSSALSAIQSTQKKQKLSQSTLYKRGIDVNSKALLPKMDRYQTTRRTRTTDADQQQAATDAATDAATSTSTAENALFKTTFSSTENGPSETVMQQKHQFAMEEFIHQRMGSTARTNHSDSTTTTNSTTNLAGTTTTNNNNNNDDTTNNNHNTNDTNDDDDDVDNDDMGAGGTMLGGTGIAEVILPVDQRLQTVQDTEELRATLPMAFGGTSNNNRNSNKKKASISSAGYHLQQSDVAGVAASFSQNFRTDRSPKQMESLATTDNGSASATGRTAADHDRVGFQAARQAGGAGGQLLPPLHGNAAPNGQREGRPHHQRANDDRLLKRFIKRERQHNKR